MHLSVLHFLKSLRCLKKINVNFEKLLLHILIIEKECTFDVKTIIVNIANFQNFIEYINLVLSIFFFHVLYLKNYAEWFFCN